MHIIRKNFTLQKFLLVFCITFLSSFCLMSAVNTIKAYAVDGNGDDITHPGDLNGHNGEGYPSSSKSGWLAYLYDYKSGSTPFGAKLIPTGNLGGSMVATSVFGVSPSGKVSFDIDKPFTAGGGANGAKVKNGLISEDSKYFWKKVVTVCWGEATLQKVLEEPDRYYLVLEVVTSHAASPGPGGGSGVYTATVHNWAHLHTKEGQTDGRIGWCDNAVAPDSAYLNQDWEGLPAVPTVHATSKYSAGGRLPSSLVGDNSLGYGMVAV